MRATGANVDRLAADLDNLGAEGVAKVAEITARLDVAAGDLTTVALSPTKINVKVVALCLAWLPAG